MSGKRPLDPFLKYILVGTYFGGYFSLSVKKSGVIV